MPSTCHIAPIVWATIGPQNLHNNIMEVARIPRVYRGFL